MISNRYNSIKLLFLSLSVSFSSLPHLHGKRIRQCSGHTTSRRFHFSLSSPSFRFTKQFFLCPVEPPLLVAQEEKGENGYRRNRNMQCMQVLLLVGSTE